MKSEEGKLQLPILNLPDIQSKISEREQKFWIFDSLRKKELVLTPEEWVRQHWISYLISNLNYPKGLLTLEKGLKYNQLQKRTDLVVWNTEGKPYLLIECKAPQVPINQKTVEQACLYHHQLQTEYLILSNGLVHISLQWLYEEKKFVQLKKFPEAPK
ncbi:Type I restriction enzyme R protein N terminus (HSDR_N) [Algoriphagus ornithinivorans]|uniref:Type I restriction enzyme R protein N terminus (HSDR_N) n=1 Tax=Algoriphagus ornithinivorans TaxID=226506 RepID=A0A1I5H261_9BACT|nr:type I restriction enzyme HsdR N-terminal domain-containing protein [Algoriphagus ornithinivorans]SFO42384.1 Type I restriction enzyme R protein N terminus (HSDR_N) [Algoriphagus ornithinivorans]